MENGQQPSPRKQPEWLAIDPDGQTKQGIPLWLALILFFVVIAIFLFGKR